MNSTDKKLIGCLALLVGAILVSDNLEYVNIPSKKEKEKDKYKKDIVLVNDEKIALVNNEKDKVGIIRTSIKSVRLNIKKFWKWIY